jgi:S1-C subfamily serine protease
MKKIIKIIGIWIGTAILLTYLTLNIMYLRDVDCQLTAYNDGLNTLSYYLSEFNSYNKLIAQCIKSDIEILKMLGMTKDYIDKKDNVLLDGLKSLYNYVDLQPRTEKIKKMITEGTLMQIVVMIENVSEGTQGSGVTLKYNNQYYILSAGHMIDKENDEIYMSENGMTICKLKIIKIDKKKDLVLFAPENEDIIPHYYSELAEKDATRLDSVYVVGNPIGIEDVLSEARIIKYTEGYFYFLDHSYFGSSGGGIFTMDGKLLGIISHMQWADPNPGNVMGNLKPTFVINGAVNTQTIKEFLKDIK